MSTGYGGTATDTSLDSLEKTRKPGRGVQKSVTIPVMPQGGEHRETGKTTGPRTGEGTGGDGDAGTDGGPQDEAAARMRLRVERHLADVEKRLSPDSFALFLKVVSGLSRAFGRHNQHVDIDLTPAERDLYTPEFQQEVVRLLEKADFPASRIVTDRFVPSQDEDRAVDRARRRHG